MAGGGGVGPAGIGIRKSVWFSLSDTIYFVNDKYDAFIVESFLILAILIYKYFLNDLGRNSRFLMSQIFTT